MNVRAPGRVGAFVAVTVCCVVGAVGFGVLERDDYREERSGPPSVAHTAPTTYAGEPRIVFRNTTLDSANGVVAEVPLADPGAPRALSDVACERVDAVRSGVSCLRADRGVVTTYEWLDLAPDLGARATTGLTGTPSRTRLSPDGRLVASTVFVTGHSYMQVGFSTATVVRRVGGKSYGNLERFQLVIDGRRVRAADRNIWGVTFLDDRTFYATAATGGTPYLVRGDLSSRTLTTVRPGAECPSLSPDGTRVAYKVDVGSDATPHWRLAVLDLRTGTQRVLGSERRSVDDQVAWLDGRTLLYGLPRATQAGVTDVWALAADGQRPPRRFLENAWSPSVVH